MSKPIISQVKHHFLLRKQIIAARHLGETGEARRRHSPVVPAVNALLELLTEGRALGARVDERHPFCQD